jgi:endo-1,4-beta-xylanase
MTAGSRPARGKYYTNAVKWASLTGVASGSGGLFRGGDDILRQDMAVMLYRYAALRGISLSAAGSDSFTDDGTIASYAREAVYALRNAGIISGMGDGSFVPGGTATRAQVAQIFRNFAART